MPAGALTVRVFIVFRDAIYASGLAATLAVAPGIDAVGHAPSIALAWEDEGLTDADVVLLDGHLGGAVAFLQEMTVGTRSRTLICLQEASTDAIVEAMANGAAGALARESVTPDTLLAAVNAAAAGIVALDATSLRTLTGARANTVPDGAQAPRAPVAPGRFTAREQMVLSLVASGLSNREIAERLSYSERTIKSVLHDVVTKLGVKSRSQAVALAVRERMI